MSRSRPDNTHVGARVRHSGVDRDPSPPATSGLIVDMALDLFRLRMSAHARAEVQLKAEDEQIWIGAADRRSRFSVWTARSVRWLGAFGVASLEALCGLLHAALVSLLLMLLRLVLLVVSSIVVYGALLYFLYLMLVTW